MLTTACRSLFLFLLSSLYPLWSLFCSAVNYLLKIFHLCLGSKLVAAGYLAINKFQFILIVCLHCSLVRNCFCHWLLVSLHTVIWLFFCPQALPPHEINFVPLKQVKVIYLVQSDDFYVILLVVFWSSLQFLVGCWEGNIFGLTVLTFVKLMKFYKVSSYIRVFVVSLYTKLGHVSGWKLLISQAWRLIS